MIALLWWWMAAGAQELLVKININSQQVTRQDEQPLYVYGTDTG